MKKYPINHTTLSIRKTTYKLLLKIKKNTERGFSDIIEELNTKAETQKLLSTFIHHHNNTVLKMIEQLEKRIEKLEEKNGDT